MNVMVTRLWARIRGNSGQGMAEYSIIAAAIVVAAYLGFKAVGNDVNSLVRTIFVAF